MPRRMTIALAALSSAVAIASVRSAPAEEEFDLRADKGAITIQTKGHWHVNQDYPWKAVVGDATYDKSKFSFTETSARLSGLPVGKAKIKGAVCDGPHCFPFTKEVAVQ